MNEPDFKLLFLELYNKLNTVLPHKTKDPDDFCEVDCLRCVFERGDDLYQYCHDRFTEDEIDMLYKNAKELARELNLPEPPERQ